LLHFALAWILACILTSPATAQRPLQLVLTAGDGASLAGHAVEAAGAGWSGLFEISPAGRVTLPGAAAAAGREVRLQLVRRGEGAPFHPVSFNLQASDTASLHGVVLIPEQWTIRRGRFAGQTVAVDLVGAFEPGCWNCSSFFRRVADPVPGYARGQIATWPQSSLPIRVAFERGGVLQGRITERDSVAFWAGARDLEEVLGRRLFRPVTYTEILPRGADDFADDILLVSAEPTLAEHGLGSAVSQRGDIFFGAVRLRTSGLLHSTDGQRLLIHELLHALGLGHTCSWRSIMADGRCPGRRSSGLTAEDVAHLELLLAVRESQRRTGAVFGLEAALAGVVRDPARRLTTR
jgi:hypothetical protein